MFLSPIAAITFQDVCGVHTVIMSYNVICLLCISASLTPSVHMK